ncbi:MAG: pentapeptide repeat-containing protein, partial [Nitrosopumilus sp.]|uniref:pentapeptide repeat-containing protein n=1 Tax=Nitrosopumilus sp. TaxID=2024843 RepID=UPI00242D13E4
MKSCETKYLTAIIFLVFFTITIPITSFSQEDVKSITVEIKSLLGDRLDTYQTVLKIYQDDNTTPIQIIEFPQTNPIKIDGLPSGHSYKIETYVTGILSDITKIHDETETTIHIPLQGGMTFSILYEDGQTPIKNAKISIKSQDGKVWQQDIVGTDGKSKKFWLQSNNLVDDHYIVEVTLDQSLTFTNPEQITIFPNIQGEIKIKTPWPAIVDDLITVSLYKDSTQKIDYSNGKYIVELFDNKNNKISESIVNHKGDAFFSNLKVGQYYFKIIEQSKSSIIEQIEFPITNIVITGKESSFTIFGQPPIQKAENTCNCVAFRLDDVQDYFLNTSQIEIMKTFQEKGAPLTLGIIGEYWGKDQKILNFIKDDLDNQSPTFEIASHSWNNTPLSNLSKEEQKEQLKNTNDVIQETLGVIPSTLIAVQNKFNEDTISALEELGFAQFTAHVDEVHSPPYLKEMVKLYYLPANTETAILNPHTNNWDKINYQSTFTEAQDFIYEHGFAIVMMHPYEFTKKDYNGYTNEVDFEHIDNLKKLIDKFRENDIEIVNIEQIPKKTSFKSKPIDQETNSCNCVYFRFIALQDYWLNEVQIKVIDTFVQNESSLTVGLIGNVIGDDYKFVNYLKNTINRNENISIANNGWNYKVITDFSREEQKGFLEQSNTKIEKIFGEKPSIFIPPYDIFNEDTILAMQENDMINLSSNIKNDPLPFDENLGVNHFPGSAVTGIYNTELQISEGISHEKTFVQIQDSLANNGFAVVTLSPPEFAKIDNSSYLNEVNELQIKELELLIQKIQDEGLTILPIIDREINPIEEPIPINGKIADCEQIFSPFLDLSGCDLTNSIVQQTDLSHSNLIKTNFSNLNIKNVNFANAIMTEANLENISMTGGSFENATLHKVNLSNADLLETNLRGADLSGADLKKLTYVNSDARGAVFADSDLTEVVFKGVGLTNTDFVNAVMINADMSGINLGGSNLNKVSFENANLTGTSFVKAHLVEVNLNGADLTNANLKEADLSGADLSGAILENIILSNAILSRADLSGANLTEISLKDVNLSNANLKEADLSGADLSGANLNGADLTNANLKEADLSGADLSGAILENIILSNAILSRADLSG